MGSHSFPMFETVGHKLSCVHKLVALPFQIMSPIAIYFKWGGASALKNRCRFLLSHAVFISRVFLFGIQQLKHTQNQQ